MERWGENSLYVKGALEWASLPPTNAYQQGWVQRGGKGNRVSTVTPEKPLPSASLTHCLLEKHTVVLLPPQTSLLLWEGRGGSVETRVEANLGLSNEKEELLADETVPGEHRLCLSEKKVDSSMMSWSEHWKLSLQLSIWALPWQWTPWRSMDNLPGQCSCWNLNGEKNHSSVVQETIPLLWAYAPQDFWAAAAGKAVGTHRADGQWPGALGHRKA